MADEQKIVIIDDEEDIGELISAAAEGLGLACVSTHSPEAFLRALDSDTTLVFLDLVMPQLDGIELLRLLSSQPHKPKIVLMSGVGKRVIETAHRLAESLGLTIAAELPKPFRLSQVEDILTSQTIRTERSSEKTHQAPIEITENEIRTAIQRNEFVLHYQPQIRLKDESVIGLEALVRWQHPRRGLVFPDNFISHTERLGLIDDLSWIVVTLALAEQASFSLAAGYDISLSINISVNSLRDLMFPDRLISIINEHRISTGEIVIEITESGLIEELSSTLDVLTRLRMKGIRLSIDDFGTGYSMMQQLRLVPANEIKIDRSFVQHLHIGGSDRVMVLKTIEIAHELEMTVVAEGVETHKQLAFLKEHSCDIAQGYLFSRPLPAIAMREWLTAWSGRLKPNSLLGQ